MVPYQHTLQQSAGGHQHRRGNKNGQTHEKGYSGLSFLLAAFTNVDTLMRHWSS